MALPTSITTTSAPTSAIVSEADLRAYVGAPPTAAVAGLAAAASDLLDGPDSLTGVCWRSRGLSVEYRAAWPTGDSSLPEGVCGYLWLPGPVPSTVTVTYLNEAGATVALADPDVIAIDGRQYYVMGAEPDGYDGLLTVAYTTVADIPDGVKQLVSMWAAGMYAERSAFSSDEFQHTLAAQVLLGRYRVRRPPE